MTVDLHTGEIVESPHLSATDARALTDQIRSGLATAYDRLIEAWMGRADLALGYESWEAYCAGEFTDGRMVRLDREQRREVVATMRDAGMSTRAIGSAIGASRETVRTDVAGDKKLSPAPNGAPAPVTGIDGKTYNPPTRPPAPSSSTPKPEAVLTPEQQERLDRQAEREEVQRRQRVETTLLCEHVVVIAQSLDLDLGHYYTAEYVIPGRAVTCQVIADAIAALGQLALVWKERDLP